MTMRELAQLANVSVSTVSKAFGDADDVCAETKEHIFRLAKQYGCFGKYYKGKYYKKVFAIICSELISNYYIGFVERLQNLIEQNGGIAVISSDHFSEKRQAELIEYYASYLRVDGIVVFGLKTNVKKGYDIPVISLFSSHETNVDAITVDFTRGMQQAIELLYENGHRRIACISEKLTAGKAELFEKICTRFDGVSTTVFESSRRFESAGKDGVRALFEHGIHYTALVCAYDNIAIGAMQELKKMGISVPRQVSVIGADNINAAEFIETPLTTIDSATDEVVLSLWELLLKKHENKYYRANRDIIIKSSLVLRSSVACVEE